MHVLDGVESDIRLLIVLLIRSHGDCFLKERIHLRVFGNIFRIDIFRFGFPGAPARKAVILHHDRIACPQIVEQSVLFLRRDIVLIVSDIAARHAVSSVVDFAV